MSDRLITVASFWSVPEAYLAKAWLEEAGIECFIQDEHVWGLHLGVSAASGGVEVQVRESDLVKASQILESEAPKGREANGPKTRCPACGATDIREQRFTLAIFLAFLFSAPPANTPRRLICRQCGHKWIPSSDDQ